MHAVTLEHAIPTRQPASAAMWILLAATSATILDLAFAFIWWAPLGVSPQKVLQSIAVHWGWGSDAYRGGRVTAALGAFLFISRMFVLSAAYHAAAKRYAALIEHPWIGGALFGSTIYMLNQYIVLPLLAPTGRVDSTAWTVACITAHMLLIGAPLAWFSRWSLRSP